MKTVLAACAALLLAGFPALASPIIDLPNLTWPPEATAPETAAPVAKGCVDPSRPATAVPCDS